MAVALNERPVPVIFGAPLEASLWQLAQRFDVNTRSPADAVPAS
jgi:hypothetical protein